ncbi:hypothetical protein ABFB09_09350 [Dehalogenimonas sp. THU2]|uniref:hypothetical protein n=1 Tax=Dehalogenimonas sp. THU2 TaxID=3151121 RepID=UPI0032189F98
MKIFGADFTSAPRHAKPITVAEAELRGETLEFVGQQSLSNAQELLDFLNAPGAWIGAFDFPFGLPRELVTDSHWPQDWVGYVDTIHKMGKAHFENHIRGYRSQKTGKNRLCRETDKKARSRSPMQLDFIPVGKMFFFGAPILLRSNCTIVPFRDGTPNAGIVVEGYPKLVAEEAVGKLRYKSESPSVDSRILHDIRNSILIWLTSHEVLKSYGFKVQIDRAHFNECLSDGKGDKLDALLCTLQAAWAWSRRSHQYGIPNDCDLLEGWIIDPAMLAK